MVLGGPSTTSCNRESDGLWNRTTVPRSQESVGDSGIGDESVRASPGRRTANSAAVKPGRAASDDDTLAMPTPHCLMLIEHP